MTGKFDTLKASENMTTEFFMAMNPPTVTQQMHRVKIINGKKIFYNSPELNDARSKLLAHLAKHIPDKSYDSAVRLTVKWLFPIKGSHHDGEYKTTRPDTDNLQKMLKDVMTDLTFWKDDALVASEIVEKFWAAYPGIYIKIESLTE